MYVALGQIRGAAVLSAPSPVSRGAAPMAAEETIVSKQYDGYTYTLAHPGMAVLLKGVLADASVSSGAGAGWSTGGVALPEGDMVLLFDAPGAKSALDWHNAKRSAGYAVLLGNMEGPGWEMPQADVDRLTAEIPAAAGNISAMLATKSIKLASELTALPGERLTMPLWVVIDDTGVTWKKPGEVDDTGKEKPPYLLYAGVGAVALLGIGYLATR